MPSPQQTTQFIKVADRLPEKIIIACIIFIAIIGLLYMPKSPFAGSTSTTYSSSFGLTTTPSSTSNSTLNTNNSLAPAISKQPVRQLHIKGDLVAGEMLLFTIDSFDEEAVYQLDIGKGVVLDLDKKNFYYAFPKSGTYSIKLMVSYQGETAIIHTEQLFIARPRTFS